MKNNRNDRSLLKVLEKGISDSSGFLSKFLVNSTLFRTLVVFFSVFLLILMLSILVNDILQGRIVLGSLSLLFLLSALLSLYISVARYRRTKRTLKGYQEEAKDHQKKTQQAIKVKEKYPGFSVIGVFLNRSQTSQVAAQNIISIPICLSCTSYILHSTYL